MGGGLRIATVALALLVAGCSKQQAQPAAEPRETIACALGSEATFEQVCSLERADRGGEKLYVVHHPDGGFRSFTVLANGAGLAAADGAEQTTQTLTGNQLEVAVGGDRYRFPVTAKAL
ncbi:MAG TPA: hypothetical protein VFP14_04820 [Novosphingobium sp.]|nr:hypothetical protein [Novosphingobium sp.]